MLLAQACYQDIRNAAHYESADGLLQPKIGFAVLIGSIAIAAQGSE
jgi:hypothetical protein